MNLRESITLVLLALIFMVGVNGIVYQMENDQPTRYVCTTCEGFPYPHQHGRIEWLRPSPSPSPASE